MSEYENPNEVRYMDVQLLGWNTEQENQNRIKPANVVLILKEKEDVEFFRQYTVQKGKVGGQLFRMGIQISPDDDQSKPMVKRPPQKLSNIAYLICLEPNFWKFLKEKAHRPEPCNSFDEANLILKKLLAINSKDELDTNPEIAKFFEDGILADYYEWANR